MNLYLLHFIVHLNSETSLLQHNFSSALTEFNCLSLSIIINPNWCINNLWWFVLCSLLHPCRPNRIWRLRRGQLSNNQQAFSCYKIPYMEIHFYQFCLDLTQNKGRWSEILISISLHSSSILRRTLSSFFFTHSHTQTHTSKFRYLLHRQYTEWLVWN